MAIEFDDLITISFAEWCDGKVTRTSIRELAEDHDIYNKSSQYFPVPMRVGSITFPEGLYEELVGKEVGAKGTVIIPPEKAYGERSDEKIHSIHKKELTLLSEHKKGSDMVPSTGENVSSSDYGKGIIVGRVGSHFIVDFNHPFAGEEIKFEYEIHEIIKDPAEQFSRILKHLLACGYENSFENGNGIVSIKLSPIEMTSWNSNRTTAIAKLFERHPSLDTLELREEYENIFQLLLLDKAEAKVESESEQIKIGDLITFNFIERRDGKVWKTNIEQIAIDNDIYDENFQYVPDVYSVGASFVLEPMDSEFIGKEVGAKGTFIIPPDKKNGMQSDEKICSIDRKDAPKDAKIGSHIHHHIYGDGIIVKKIGRRFVVDFNHELAEKEIELEYEIIKKITDPAEQFDFLLTFLVPKNCNSSFENGKGIINVEIPLILIDAWADIKTNLMLDLFSRLPSLKALEIREKYEKDLDECVRHLLLNN